MALTSGATHTLQWRRQRAATEQSEANRQTAPQCRSGPAPRPSEGGVGSTRVSAWARRIRSRALYTPPVTSWELPRPEGRGLTCRKVGGSGRGPGERLGRSRNKVAVPEG